MQHIFFSGCLRVWNMKTSTEVFKQNEPLVTPPDLEGAPTIAQLQYNALNDHLYVVSFDHNIFVNAMKDLSLVKQVVKIFQSVLLGAVLINYLLLLQYAGYNDDILDIAWYGEGETHLAVATNSTHVKVNRQ